jgi:putative hydrolase of the HAD superfamily
MALRAVLFDALGTLVELRPPAPRLRAAIERRTGVDVGAEAAERGFAAEIGHYLANHMRGGDEHGLERLRDECAQVMLDAIVATGGGATGAVERGSEAAGADGVLRHDAVRAAMLEALEFSPFPDAIPTLTELRERGLRLVVVSNWDCSLERSLAAAGVAELLDGAVSSAVVGAAKPAAAPFEAGLELAGCSAAEAVHVGDSIESDVEGARAAGLRAILVQRRGEPPAGVEAVRSLRDLSRIL